MAFDWAPYVERLKELWAAGLTGGAIAEKLGGGLTRCAVIAKAHRLGLAARQKTSGVVRVVKKSSGGRRRRLVYNPHLKAIEHPQVQALQGDEVPPGMISPFQPAGHECSWDELDSERCAWPIDAGRYCGARVSAGRYCEFHVMLSRRPTQKLG